MVSVNISKIGLSVIILLVIASFIYAEYAQDSAGILFNSVGFLSPSPANNSYVNNVSNLFIINASGNLSYNPPNMFNLSIYTWNAAGGIFNMTNVTFPNQRGAIQIIASDGTYNVTLNMSNVTFSNFTARYNITVDSRNPNLTLTYPLANSNLSFFNITVNSTSQDTNLNDTIISVYASGVQVGNSVVITGNNNASVNFTTNGRYSIFATSYDRAGNSNTSSRNITIDTTSPVMTIFSPLNNTNYYANQTIVINFGATELSPFNYWYYNGSSGANITFNVGSLTTVNYTSLGWYNLTFYANDSTAHLTAVRIAINVIALPGTSYLINDSSYSVNATVSSVIVPYNTSLQNITLINISQIVALDLSQVLDNSTGTVTAGNNFSLVTIGTYNYTVYIPQFVNITGGAGWDGKINLPTINDSTFTAPASGTKNIVVDTGNSVSQLNFSAPVKVVIGGMGGKSGAWSRGSSSLTAISTICNNTESPTNIDAVTTRECYNSTGSDLIIWTYHFTSFAAYTPAVVVTTIDTGGSSEGTVTGWYTTFVPNVAQLTSGYNLGMIAKTRVQIMFGTEKHYVGVISVNNLAQTAIINVSSDPQQKIMNINEEWKVNLNTDNYYDLSIKLNNVSLGKASLTIKTINEVIPASVVTTPVETTVTEKIAEKVAEVTGTWSMAKKVAVSVGILLALVVLIVGIILWIQKINYSRLQNRVKTIEFARK